MTRMRAVELGVPIVHAAVTGKSTITDNHGTFTGTTGLGTGEIFYGQVGATTSTPFTTTGNAVMWAAAVIGFVTVARRRRLVSSQTQQLEEE
jgi:apolipoprotein N-acyltransferase